MELRVSKKYKIRYEGSVWEILTFGNSIKAGETICHLCGKELERLTPLHAKAAHNMTWEEFLQDRAKHNGETVTIEKWSPKYYFTTFEGVAARLFELGIGEQAANSLKELVAIFISSRNDVISVAKKLDDRVRKYHASEEEKPREVKPRKGKEKRESSS